MAIGQNGFTSSVALATTLTDKKKNPLILTPTITCRQHIRKSKLNSPLTLHIANFFGTVVLNHHTERSTKLDEQETNTFNFNTAKLVCRQPRVLRLDSRCDTINLLWVISAPTDGWGINEWRGKRRVEGAFDLHSATYQRKLFELNAEKAWLWNSSAPLPNPRFQTFFLFSLFRQKLNASARQYKQNFIK